jgi:predicted phosphoribosyltransferase
MGKVIEEKGLRGRTGVFSDRTDAGWMVGAMVESLPGLGRPVVYAIPSGGVPIGIEVARILQCRMWVTVVRKIHIPWNQEAGFGAVAWDGTVTVDRDLAASLRIGEREIESEVEETKRNVQRRMELFARGQGALNVSGCDVVVTDDGLAAGYTMFAAIEAIRKLAPNRIIVAVPTGPETTVAEVADRVDVVVCPNIREGHFFAVADAYQRWHDLSEGEVMQLLRQAAEAGILTAESA